MVNWGILSTARINRKLIPAIHSSPDANLLAVASRDKAKAESYAETWEIKRGYGSYQDLLDDPDVHVVYISLPNDLHTEWTIRAMEAGKHVLCEKPLCTAMADMDRIIETARVTGKHVAEAFMYLHHPQTRLFKSIIDAGRIGELTSMHSNFSYSWSREADNYRLTEEDGGGSLWDIGVYPVSFFQFITGEPAIIAKGVSFPGPVDMRFGAVMQYPNGVTGTFYTAFDTYYSTETIFNGTEGRLRITRPYNYMEKGDAWLEKDDTAEKIPLPEAPLYQLEVDDMNSVVQDGRSPYISLDRSREFLKTVLELRKSAGL